MSAAWKNIRPDIVVKSFQSVGIVEGHTLHSRLQEVLGKGGDPVLVDSSDEDEDAVIHTDKDDALNECELADIEVLDTRPCMSVHVGASDSEYEEEEEEEEEEEGEEVEEAGEEGAEQQAILIEESDETQEVQQEVMEVVEEEMEGGESVLCETFGLFSCDCVCTPFLCAQCGSFVCE